MLTRQRGFWRPFRRVPHGPPPPERVTGASARVTFINHSTVLLQTAGHNVLTDPVFAMRASPLPIAGPRRVRNPGIRFRDLPPIDVVFISHNHFDHMEESTLCRLHRRFRPRFVAPLGNAALLKRFGIPDTEELDWWETIPLSAALRLTAIPAQHWSARGFADRNRSLWAGMVLEGVGRRIIYPGDTGFGPHLREIAARWPEGFAIALLPIGAYKPRWFMKTAHCTPGEAVRMHRILRAKLSIPIHYGTFALGDDGEDEALEDLARARDKLGVAESEFPVLDFGAGMDL